MTVQNDDYDELDQYDYFDGEYLEKVIDKYSSLVGLFIINFSILERDLNIAIADLISDRAHDMGYTVIENLSTSNKIELFYKLWSRLESYSDNQSKKKLIKIKNKFEEVNSFRNSIVHANWQTLTKDKYVRTKIVVDRQEGYVKFKKVEMTPKIIRQKIKDIDNLSDQISDYTETFWELFNSKFSNPA